MRNLIESSGAVEELDQILAKSSRDPKETTKEEIEKLEAQLNARQIGLLNELSAWVLGGRESLSVEQLEAALFLRFKETILEILKTSDDHTIFIGMHSRRTQGSMDCSHHRRRVSDRP